MGHDIVVERHVRKVFSRFPISPDHSSLSCFGNRRGDFFRIEKWKIHPVMGAPIFAHDNFHSLGFPRANEISVFLSSLFRKEHGRIGCHREVHVVGQGRNFARRLPTHGVGKRADPLFRSLLFHPQCHIIDKVPIGVARSALGLTKRAFAESVSIVG